MSERATTLGLLRAELLKLKQSWLLRLSFILAVLFPLLTLVMTLTGAQMQRSTEPRFLLLMRQNHIFVTLFMGNLLFGLIAIDLFFKEFQHRTIVDIIAVPVSRLRLVAAKEIVLLAWMLSLALFSYLVCLILGTVFLGFSWDVALAALWRYSAATVMAFVPLQILVWVTLAARSYLVPLGVSIVAAVGSIVAFNTKEIIFIYPFSVGFVLTNFVEPIQPRSLGTAFVSLAVVASVCFPALVLRLRRMDI